MRKTTLFLLSLLIGGLLASLPTTASVEVDTSMTEWIDEDCIHVKKKLHNFSLIVCEESNIYVKSWDDPILGTRAYDIGTGWDGRTVSPFEGTSTSIFAGTSGSLPTCPGPSVQALATSCLSPAGNPACPGGTPMTWITVEETSFNHFNCKGICSNGAIKRWEACTMAQPSDPPPTYPPCESPCPFPPICPPPPICCGPGCP